MNISLRTRSTFAMVGVSFLTLVVAALAIWFFFEVYEAITPEVVYSEATSQRLSELETSLAALEDEIASIEKEWIIESPGIGLTLLFLCVSASFVVLAIAISAFASRWITRPITAVKDHLRMLVSGDYTAQVAPGVAAGYGQEIEQLVSDSNALAQELHHQDQRVRKDAAVIAHELRTPLTAITSQLHAIQDGVMIADDAILEAMLRNAKALSTIINDLRTMSLADAGHLELSLREIDLQRLLDDLLATFQTRFDAAGISVEQALVSATVLADEVRISQAVQTIFDNALKHAEGASRLSISCSDDGDRAKITITDDGIGLPQNVPAHQLFHPFNGGSKAGQSSGLGLAVATSLIRAHGGQILATNAETGGASFTIELERASST